MSDIKLPINAHRFTLAAYESMQSVYIDTINLNQPDTDKNQNIIVIIVAFSRWTELHPSKDLTALSAAKHNFSLLVDMVYRVKFIVI